MRDKFKKKQKILMLLVIFFLFVCLWIVHKYISKDLQEKTIFNNFSKKTSNFIKVSYPLTMDFYRVVPFIGEVIPKKKINLVAHVSGRIVSIYVPDETPVKKGEVIFILGGPEIEKRLKIFETRLKILEKELISAKKALKRKAEGAKAKIIPYDEFLSAREHFLNLKTKYEVLKTEFKFFKAQLQIKAPISGIFTKRCVSIGQDVEKGAVLGEIVDSHTLYIKATVFGLKNTDLVGKTALIYVSDRTIIGKVIGMSPWRSLAGGIIVFIKGKNFPQKFSPGDSS